VPITSAIGAGSLRGQNLNLVEPAFGPCREADKYGASTTHMDKLLPRIEGGGGCPIFAFGISRREYVEDSAPIVVEASDEEDDDGE
jgi:Restriction endonuclease BglII